LPFRKLQFALDRIPGTQWDYVIEQTQLALQWKARSEKNPQLRSIAERELMHFGEFLASSIRHALKNKNADLFRGLANAIEAYAKHEPNKIFDNPVSLHLMLFCLNNPQPITVRDVIKCLKANGVKTDHNTPRIIRRWCKVFGYTYKGKPGKPSANREQK